ncbi:MAG: hypothetical protein P4M07_22880, partial [Xanthobacteraceae bacterium]|nr:hypothetical protein [Xanthobacteraceae bacterium]
DQLTLNDATVSGGAITNGDTIEVSGSSTIDGGAILNNGGVTIDAGQTLTFGNATVTGTTFTDTATGAILAVEGGDTLTLNGVMIHGGTINDGSNVTGGTIEIATSSTIDDNASLNNGGVTIDGSQTLTFGNAAVTGTTFTDTATGAILAVEGGDTLTLNGVTIDGGAINDGSNVTGGTIEISGPMTITGASLNNGGVTVDANQTLTLDNVVVSGTAFTDTAGGAKLSVDAKYTLTLENGAVVTGGGLVNAGTVYLESSTGAALDGVAVTGGGTLVTDLPETPGTLLLDDGTSITGGSLSIGRVGVVDVERGARGPGATLDGVTVTGADAVRYFGPASLIEVGVSNAASATATLTLDDGTSITGGSLTIGSHGVIEVASGTSGSGATLDDVRVSNAGAIQVDAGETLKLADVTIYGGAINAEPGTTAGAIEIIGSSTIEGTTTFGFHPTTVNAAVNGGQLIVDAHQTLTLDNVTVTGATIADHGSIDVDWLTTLDLAGIDAITGGGITDAGTLDVTGTTTLKSDSLTDAGVLRVDGTLKLDTATIVGGTITDNGTIEIAGSSTIEGTTFGFIPIDAGFNGGQLTIDTGQTLTLDNVTVTGSTITDGGTIEITGSSTIEGTTTSGFHPTTVDAALTGGQLIVDPNQTLTLDNVTVTGTTIADHGTIEISGSSTIEGSTTFDAVTGGHLTVDANQTLTLDNVTVTGTAITDHGSINIGSGTALNLAGIDTISGGAISDAGTIEVQSGSSKIGSAVTGTGKIIIDAGATLEIDSSASVAAGDTISFDAKTGTLLLDHAQNFHGTVSGFSGDGTLAGSDHIDLANINYHSTHFSEHFNSATDVLTVSDGSHSATLQFVGAYVAANFSFTSDGNGGTIVYDPPVTSTTGSGQASVIATNDVFVFAPGSGQATLTDFHSGLDKIELDYFNPTTAAGQPETFDQWAAAGGIIHQGANTLLVLDPNHPGHTDTLLLKYVASLSANDFILHPGSSAHS